MKLDTKTNFHKIIILSVCLSYTSNVLTWSKCNNNQIKLEKSLDRLEYSKVIGNASFNIIQECKKPKINNHNIITNLNFITKSFIHDENYISALNSANLLYLFSKTDETNFYIAYSSIKLYKYDITKLSIDNISDINLKNTIRAYYFFSKEYNKEALETINLVNKVPQYAQIYFYDIKEKILLSNGLLEDGIENLNKAIKEISNPYDKIETQINKGFLGLIKKVDLQKIHELSKYNLNDSTWLNLLAKYYQVLNDDNKANNTYIKAFNCPNFCSSLFINYIYFQLKNNNTTNAQQAFDYLYKINSFDFKLMNIQSEIFAKDKNYQKAVEVLKSTIKIHPDWMVGINSLAKIYRDANQFQNSINLLESNIAQKEFPQNYYDLAQLYLKIDNTPKALSNFAKFINFYTNSEDKLNLYFKDELANSYAYIGLEQYQSKNLDKAFKCAATYNKLKFIPTDNIIFSQIRPSKMKIYSSFRKHILLADMLFAADKPKLAIEEYKSALKIEPNNKDIHRYLNYIYIQNNDYLNSYKESLTVSNDIIKDTIKNITKK